MSKRLVVICGPTACGKTDLAVALAEYLPIEVISADSRQVYRHMDIGTAKPPPEVRSRVPHHVIDVVDPSHRFSAQDFISHADRAYLDIVSRGKIPVLVGGTGLYIRALEWGLCEAPPADESLRAYLKERLKREGHTTLYQELSRVDPEAASKIPPTDTQRLLRYLEVYFQTGRPISHYWREHSRKKKRRYLLKKFYVDLPIEVLSERIRKRCQSMIKKGLLEEVERLLHDYGEDAPGLKTIGYAEMVDVLKGRKSLEEAFEEFVSNTRAYAKRQKVWFKKELNEMTVIDNGDVETVRREMLKWLKEGDIAVPGVREANSGT